MRIVHIVETLDVGGLERFLLSLTKTQVGQGHTVSVICLFHPGALASSLAPGITVESCDKSRLGSRHALRVLRKLFRALTPDVVHTHNAVAHYFAALASWGRPARVFLNTRHGMGKSPFSVKREVLYRLSLIRTQHAVAVCKMAMDNFVQARIFPASIAKVVYNGIVSSDYKARNAAAKAALAGELHFPAGAVVFGTVGRLVELKNHELMFRALARLVGEGVSAALIVIGDGPHRAYLEGLCNPLKLTGHIHFLGQRADVETIVSGLDCYLCTSDTEGYSIALLEASAAALPIICTDVGGNTEIVQDKVTGLVIDKGDGEALYQAMKAIASDEALRERYGAASREWVRQNGDITLSNEQYLALYRTGN